MRDGIPFRIFKRGDKPYYYVRYRKADGTLGGTLTTKEADKEAAFKTAMDWFLKGIPQKGGGRVRADIREALSSGEVTAGDAEYIMRDLQRRGLVESYALKRERERVGYGEFLLEFWDWERSAYIREKLHKEGSVHKHYADEMHRNAEVYFYGYWKGRDMNEIRRREFTEYVSALDGEERFSRLSAARKNKIMASGTIPVKWAVRREIIEKDFTLGFERYKGEARRRLVITPEMAAALFSEEWGDERARLGNMASFVTGMRAGEARGLQCRDIGESCLYINRAWSRVDGLKLPKNNEKRVVELPFPGVMEGLTRLAMGNPHGARPERFVFWNKSRADRPVDYRVFLKGLRKTLEKIGFTKDEARKYEFHGWRHTYATFMSEKIEGKLLRTQTGHKSAAMLARYADHTLEADKAKIRAAQLEAFGRCIGGGNEEIFMQ